MQRSVSSLKSYVLALSDEELSCLGVSTIGDRLRVRGLCANAEKDHPSVAAKALFSGRSRSSRRGAERKAVTKRSWTVSFICVADRYQSTDKQVLFHAGLGMKKIKLDLEDDEHDVLEKITCGDKGDDGEIKGFPQ